MPKAGRTTKIILDNKSTKKVEEPKLAIIHEGTMDQTDPSSVYVIREIYESASPMPFEGELEKALEKEYKYIVIEPKEFAEQTTLWLASGTVIHDASVLTSLGSICASVLVPHRPLLSVSLCGASVMLTSLYAIAWNTDPCCRYRVQNDLAKFNPDVTKRATKVLVKTDRKHRNYVQRSMTIAAVLVCVGSLYHTLK